MINIKVRCDYCSITRAIQDVTPDYLNVQKGDKEFHFCSEECLKQYLQKGGFKHE